MVVSFVWFLYLYKRNMFTRLVAGKAREDRERLNTLDRLSTVALLVLGCMACAESCGVAVQSVLTVGGIGGVATAFAARDLLGNLLSGIGLQFSRPFSVGDYISAGDVSGQVVEIGLHSTEMLNGDKFPTVVPNSFFSSQVIINKSRVRQRGLDLNIPVKLSSLEKLPTITSEVRSMLHSCPRVLLDDDVEKPRCHVSQVGATSFNLAIFCNLKPMSWDEFLVAQEEVLLEASRIVVRSDPEEPDAEKSFSDGAEMVEKPVSSSPGSEDSLPEEKAQLTTPATVSVETTTDPPAALNNQAASWVSSSLPRRSPSMSRVGALVSDPKSSPRSSGRRQLVSAAATESPSTPRISNSMPASPRSRGHSGLLGVGSKLISRIKHSSKKH